ncbi:holin [Gordonia phage Lucky10]|uniref:Holin n=1 Tax=Gordonia phage Lucky10 TaxID=1821557 RepID=A0A142KAY2_9CAUD|nr:holin [Gordonia phage Lucky10]AMS03265.1 holin [Gordonia phage Lucky10]
MLGARLMAAVTGCMQVVVGVLYISPEELVRRPLQPGQVSAVVWVESIGPMWFFGFLLTGLALLLAVARRRGFIFAHIATSVFLAFYAGCILFSAVLTEPPVPVVHGTFAGFMAILHIAIARGDAERNCR